MLNIILIICEVIVAYIAMTLLYKKYKTDGLITYTIIATIISNLMCLKKIDMLNTELPLGLGITMSILIAINIITQNKGKEEVNNFLVIILVSSLVSLCFFNLSGLIESADINKYANKSYDSIFTYNLRIYLANTITLLVTTFLSSRLYFMLKILKNKILKYTYLSEALPIDMDTKNKFMDFVKSFLKIKFKLLINTLSESSEPLIDDGTPKDEVELFKDLLIDYLKNFVIYIYKDKELSKKIEEIIEKHRGDYSYFEYLLRNPFLLKLKLSIEDPNYHDTMLDVFKKHKVKTPKEIMDRVKTKNQEDCISYLKLMEIIIKNGNSSTPSKSNFTSNPYLDDLSLIYKAAKSKLYNYNFVINYELEECETFELDASESQKLIRKK